MTAIVSTFTLTSTTSTQGMGGINIPVTLTLTSNTVGRKLELSTDNGVTWYDAPLDSSTADALVATVYTSITNFRGTGDIGDTLTALNSTVGAQTVTTPIVPTDLWSSKLDASEFGVGQAWFSDIKEMGYSNGTEWSLQSKIKPRSNIYTRSPIGITLGTAAVGGFTSHHTIKLAAKPYAVRIAIPCNVSTPPVNVGSFGFDDSLGALSSAQDKGSLVATWYPLTWDGATSAVSEPRVSTNQPSWVWSDWIPCSPPDLVSGSGAILHVNVRQGVGSGTATWWGTSSRFAPTAQTEAVAPHVWRSYQGSDATDYATANQSTFTGTLVGADCQACLVQYASVVPGHTMLVIGDSISSGISSGLNAQISRGYGWAEKARDLLSTDSMPIEVCNLGWPSQTMAQARPRYEDVAAAIDKSLLFHMAWSPNGVSTPLTAANIDTTKKEFSKVLSLAHDYRCVPILQTGTPANARAVDGGSGGTSAKSFAAGDPLRVAYNTEIKLASSAGYVFDVAGTLSGSAVASGAAAGQIEYNTLYTHQVDDGLHPNDAGYTAWATGLANYLRGRL